MGAELHTRLEVRSSPTAASHVLCAGAAASVQAWSVASGMQPRKGRGLGSPRDDTALVPHEVKWALGTITMNKASGGDGIPVELFQILTQTEFPSGCGAASPSQGRWAKSESLGLDPGLGISSCPGDGPSAW